MHCFNKKWKALAKKFLKVAANLHLFTSCSTPHR